jgi:hypothetical protein
MCVKREKMNIDKIKDLLGICKENNLEIVFVDKDNKLFQDLRAYDDDISIEKLYIYDDEGILKIYDKLEKFLILNDINPLYVELNRYWKYLDELWRM